MRSLQINGPVYQVGASYYDGRAPFVFDFDYLDSAVVSHFGEGVESEVLRARVGYYLPNPALLWLSYEKEFLEYRTRVSSETMPDNDRVSVGLKTVAVLDNDTALNVETRLIHEWYEPAGSEVSTQDTFDISLDYYFNKSANVGVGYAHSWGDESTQEGNTFLVRGKIFLSAMAWASLALSEFDSERRGYGRSALDVLVGLRY